MKITATDEEVTVVNRAALVDTSTVVAIPVLLVAAIVSSFFGLAVFLGTWSALLALFGVTVARRPALDYRVARHGVVVRGYRCAQQIDAPDVTRFEWERLNLTVVVSGEAFAVPATFGLRPLRRTGRRRDQLTRSLRQLGYVVIDDYRTDTDDDRRAF